MRKVDPLLVAIALSVTLCLGTVSYVVGSILTDPHPSAPVPYSSDPHVAQETLDTIRLGEQVGSGQYRPARHR